MLPEARWWTALYSTSGIHRDESVRPSVEVRPDPEQGHRPRDGGPAQVPRGAAVLEPQQADVWQPSRTAPLMEPFEHLEDLTASQL